MSLQTYTANYRPSMHTTAFSVVHISGFLLLLFFACLFFCYLRCKGKRYPFLVGLLSANLPLKFYRELFGLKTAINPPQTH